MCESTNSILNHPAVIESVALAFESNLADFLDEQAEIGVSEKVMAAVLIRASALSTATSLYEDGCSIVEAFKSAEELTHIFMDQAGKQFNELTDEDAQGELPLNEDCKSGCENCGCGHA